MNYLAEILAFYDWTELNPVDSSQFCLWHVLMYVANKTGWRDEFTVPMSTLEFRTGLKRTTIYAARNALKQAGRIDYYERNGNQSAIYRLCPFREHNTDTIPTQQRHNSDTTATQYRHNTDTTATQQRPLYKLNKTKWEDTDVSSKKNAQMEQRFDSFWAAYPKKRSKGDAFKAWKALNPSSELVATMLNKLAQAKTCDEWEKENGKYIPYPATWLRDMRWEDEYVDKGRGESTKGPSGHGKKPSTALNYDMRAVDEGELEKRIQPL